jgi:hypothetical protein
VLLEGRLEILSAEIVQVKDHGEFNRLRDRQKAVLVLAVELIKVSLGAACTFRILALLPPSELLFQKKRTN